MAGSILSQEKSYARSLRAALYARVSTLMDPNRFLVRRDSEPTVFLIEQTRLNSAYVPFCGA
jgi:hypothetical protein